MLVAVELFGQLLDLVLAIFILLFDCRKEVCQEFCSQRRCSRFHRDSSIRLVGPKMILRLGFVDLGGRIANSL